LPVSFGSYGAALLVEQLLTVKQKYCRKDIHTLAAYTLWSILNERNRRIFQHSNLLLARVAELARADVAQFKGAFRL
jgi:hypothetical protein